MVAAGTLNCCGHKSPTWISGSVLCACCIC